MKTLPSSAGGLPGPEQATAEEVAAFVVAAAVWAPSVHNTQPWWFSARGQEINLLLAATLFAHDLAAFRVHGAAGLGGDGCRLAFLLAVSLSGHADGARAVPGRAPRGGGLG